MDRKFAINLQDYMERYFQYVYDLCKKRFSSWEMREAYLGGLESTRTLNNSLQLQNVQHAVKLYPDIIDNFCTVYNNYMGKDTDCRVQKKRHLFQFFLQEFLCEMSAKLIRKQSTEKTVREIMSLLSADDRRATVDFCIQKALSSTAKYDIEIIGDILTSDDSISSIGSTPTAFNDMRRKEMEKHSKISRNSGLTESQLKNIVPAPSALPVPSAFPSSVASSSPSPVKPPIAAESVVRSTTSVPQSVPQSVSVASDAQSAQSVTSVSQSVSVASDAQSVADSVSKVSKASTKISEVSKASRYSVASSKTPTRVSDLSDSDSETESTISLDYSKKKLKPQVGLMARINKPRIDVSDEESDDDDDDGSADSSTGSNSGSGSGSEVSKVKKRKRQPPAKKKVQKSPAKKKPLNKSLSLSKNKRY